MEEPQQQQTLRAEDESTLVVGGEETTLVAPRFDVEETLVARPVVPLEGDASEAAPAPEGVLTPRPAHGYRSPYGPRRTWMLALMLVSVLVGGVLGGAGLYLYQRQSQDSGAAAQPAAPAEAAQPQTTAPTVESQSAATAPAEPAAQQPEAQAAGVPEAEEPPAPAAEAPSAAREPESVPAAERREAPAEGGSTGAPKRGKKGERDQELERRAAPRTGGNVARADEPEARRVDTIFYRQRRAARRERIRRDTADAPDRLRRIFEGTP